MNLVLNIFLLFFCIGVTYSSGVNSSSDAVIHAVKPTVVAPEVQPDPVKVQTSQSAQNSTTVPTVTHANSTVPTSSVKVEPATAESKSKPSSTVDKNNAPTKVMNTSTVTEVVPKHETTTLNKTSIPAETKITTQKSTVVPTAATLTSTAAPVVSKSDNAAPTPTTQERQFDGPSFVGGIVLTVGLTVIGFIAFKFYKSGKIERSYRTL